jgi:hypothetical protein
MIRANLMDSVSKLPEQLPKRWILSLRFGWTLGTPEMSDCDLARNILSLHPGMKRLFMSGYTADVIAHHGVLDDGVHFIQKPFSLPNMAAKVREVLDGGAI